MFPVWHIALTALLTTALTIGGTAAWPVRPAGRRLLAFGDLVGVGIAAGLGVLLWRLGANTPTLNDDPIPGVSPADVLSAPLAYVAAAVYVRLRGVDTRAGVSGAGASGAAERLAIGPAVAALVALLVNIITI